MKNHRSTPTLNLALTVLLSIGLGSCGAYSEHLLVMRANYSVSRGEYQNAIVDYLRAAESGTYNAWLAYNLGNVYHYLGESSAALDMWDVAQRSDVNDLLFGSAFNRGVYLFDRGRFAEAFEQFRYSLTLDPTNVAAKLNLELTLDMLRAEEDLSAGQSGSAERPRAAADAGGATRVLDYIRRVEEQRWRANAETATVQGPEDR